MEELRLFNHRTWQASFHTQIIQTSKEKRKRAWKDPSHPSVQQPNLLTLKFQENQKLFQVLSFWVL